MMPLTMAKAGETVTIKKITGKDEIRQHLAELGFVVESEVTVVNEIAGNLILQVKESRIALDKTMANRIMISETAETLFGTCSETGMVSEIKTSRGGTL